MKRRQFTFVTGVASLGTIAGCARLLGDDDEPDDVDDDDDDPVMDDEEPEEDDEPVDDDPDDDEPVDDDPDDDEPVDDDPDDDEPVDDDPDDDEPVDDDPDDDEPVDDDETEELESEDYIDRAADEIQAAIDLLMETIDDDDLLLDEEQLKGYLDAAGDELDEAEPGATEDQLENIGHLRRLIEYISLRGETEVEADTGFDDHFAIGFEGYWDGRDLYDQEDVPVPDLEDAAQLFEDAELAFEDAEAVFESAQAIGQDARDVLDDIPEDIVDAFDDVGYDGVAEDVDDFIWVMGEMLFFADGLGDGCRAWYHVSLGFAAFLQEDWEEGESEFGMANSSFDTAVALLDTVYDGVIDAMPEYFDEMLCEIDQGPDAATHWHAAAEAAIEDDQETHEDEIDAGWNLIVECHTD